MWKKEDEQTTQPRAESTPGVSRPQTASQGTGRATIGPSISIKGDVTGSEDLHIQGRVDGSVTLEDHAVSVGSEGRVDADIVARIITVEGRVEGDLTAQEQIVLRGSAQVKGDIKAPRVVLEDGATFRGLVDMGSASAKRTDDADAKGASSSSGSTSSSSTSSSTTGASGKGAGDQKGSDEKSSAKSGTSATGSKSSSTGGGPSSSKESSKSTQQAPA